MVQQYITAVCKGTSRVSLWLTIALWWACRTTPGKQGSKRMGFAYKAGVSIGFMSSTGKQRGKGTHKHAGWRIFEKQRAHCSAYFTQSYFILSKIKQKTQLQCAISVYCPIPSWLGHISPCERGEGLWCCKHIPRIPSPPLCSCWAYCEVLIREEGGGAMEEGSAHIRRTGRATAKNDSCSSWSRDTRGFRLHS